MTIESNTTANPTPIDRNKMLLRAMVQGMYDIQKQRIETGNRLCATFKYKLGIKPGQPEPHTVDDIVGSTVSTVIEGGEEANNVSPAEAAAARKKAAEDVKLLTQLRNDYKLITEGVVKLRRDGTRDGDGLIDNKAEAALVGVWVGMYEQEQSLAKQLAKVVEAFPIWTDWMEGVRGCGPTMAAVIISHLDIHRARYPSSVWRYAGLDVTPEGRGRSRRKAEMGTTTYTDPKTGEVKEKKTLGYNPFLKTKLMGVLADSMIKSNSQYRVVYDARKVRTQGYNAVDPERFKTPAHRHMDAKRHMIKVFLADLYAVWRGMEGLEVHPWYAEEKLGIVHSRPPIMGASSEAA